MNQKVFNHFQTVDPEMASLYTGHSNIRISASDSYFTDLAESIVCQQLSEKAGATIWSRFSDLFPSRSVTPEMVLKMSVSELRVSGVSESKANYIRNTASAFLDGRLVSSKLDRLTDQEVITVLTSVKGIGRWTAEMFLIFSLGRPDVFSFGDAGLMRAVNRLYGKKRPLTQDQIRKITRRWSPYRSYACILLWRSLA